MGITNIWGAIVVYFTSKFRAEDPNLFLQTSLYAFPLTYVSCSISMQLGAWLFHRINLKLQLLIGCLIYSVGIYLSKFATTFTTFMIYYSVMAGFGMGIVYFLPVLCGWSYFPTIRPVVAGSVLSWFTWISMGYVLYATKMLNPNNLPPTVEVETGKATQRFYAPDSEMVT